MSESVVQAGSVPATAVEQEKHVVFDGGRGPLFRILLKNLFLGILTLGIYRFWGKTNLRRYFWRHVSVAGDQLEYTGTGKELFVGFLIAIAVLVPVGIVYAILEQVLHRLAGESAGGLVAMLIYWTALLLLVQVAVYRMRRYRLTRTMWRGVRFGLDGTTKEYVRLSMKWWALTVLTLGYLNPWRRVACSAYFMRNTRFGSTHFTFDAEAGQLIGIWRPVWLLGLVLFGGWAALFVPSFVEAAQWAEADLIEPDTGKTMGIGAALLAVAVGVWTLASLVYRARELRYFANSTQIGGVRLDSHLRAGKVVGLYFGTILIAFAAYGLAIVMVVLAVTAGGPDAGGAAGPIGAVVAIFALLLLLSVLVTLWLVFGLVKHFCETLVVRNIEAIEEVVQSGAGMPGHGEGLADALDVGGSL